jgi:anti-anti-sigma factor
VINENNCELVIDLEGVDEIDSFGIGVFIATYNALLKKEKKFLITNASRPIYALLKSMGLTRRFDVLPRDPAPQIS